MFTIHFDKPFKKYDDHFGINIMHHLAFHSFESESHKIFFSIKRSTGFKRGSTVLVQSQLAPTNTFANKKKEHISLNKKSTSIREEVTTLQGELKRLCTLVASLVASQNQPQFQQGPERQHQQRPQQQAPKMQFDPIPMTYAELLPILLQENLVKTRAPPRVPNVLSVGYQPDLSCTFHQGAPDHDIEHCLSLKTQVQKLIEADILLFFE